MCVSSELEAPKHFQQTLQEVHSALYKGVQDLGGISLNVPSLSFHLYDLLFYFRFTCMICFMTFVCSLRGCAYLGVVDATVTLGF